MGGVGKSALTRELCRRVRAKYEAGIFWIDASSVQSLEASYRDIAEGDLDIADCRDASKVPVDTVRHRVWSWLRRHRGWLVVLDNVDDVAMYRDSGFAIPTDVSVAGHVLVTSRVSDVAALREASVVGHDVDVQSLPALDVEDSLAMLVTCCKGEVLSTDEAMSALKHCGDEEMAAAVWLVGRDGVDGLPLAIEQIAAYCKRYCMSFVTYRNQFVARGLELFGSGATGAYDPKGSCSAGWRIGRWRSATMD